MNLRWHLNKWLVKTALALLRLSGWYDGYWRHWRTFFDDAQNKGLHIMPVHYYSPIPDTRKLPDSLWLTPRAPVGFDLNIDQALHLLDRLSRTYGHEYKTFPKQSDGNPHRYHTANSAYLSGDAEILYAMLRDLKPKKIIEIGSGFSTLLICEAIRASKKENPDYRCEFTAIEPFPPSFLKPPPAELTRLESRPLQQVAPDIFSSLGPGDVLFIDSTHVARIGSDVVHEFLHIVPGLAPGVVIHIHDIFIPEEYPRAWIDKARFFWNEQYLVSAFLAHNPEFEVIMPTHAIWIAHADRFRKAIPSSEPEFHMASSFWIRRIPVKKTRKPVMDTKIDIPGEN